MNNNFLLFLKKNLAFSEAFVTSSKYTDESKYYDHQSENVLVEMTHMVREKEGMKIVEQCCCCTSNPIDCHLKEGTDRKFTAFYARSYTALGTTF